MGESHGLSNTTFSHSSHGTNVIFHCLTYTTMLPQEGIKMLKKFEKMM